MEKATKRFRPVHSCIYCGRAGDQAQLTDEHVIAQGLMGNLLLPEASCSGRNSCSTITGRFEQRYMRDSQDALRTFLGVHGNRRRNERRTTIPLVLTSDGEEQGHCELAPGDHPLWAVFADFDMPGALSGRTPNRTHKNRVVKINGDDSAAPYAGQFFRVPGRHEASYTIRMLAKIAHSYAVAEYGLEQFSPLLRDIILSEQLVDGWPMLVGSDEAIGPRFSGNLHELSLEARTVRGRHLIVCSVRLFACLPETPTYLVVAGEHWHASFERRQAQVLSPRAGEICSAITH